jgi:hypothetical protein
MSFQKIFSLVIVVGSILFLIAAFSPISRVFTESDPVKKLEIIRESRQAWVISQFLFTSGAIITAIGFGLNAYHFRDFSIVWLAYLGFFALIIGAGLWSWHVYLRAIEPEAFTAGTLSAWHFMAYTLLTQVGLVVIGVVLLRSELPGWVGWLNIGGCALFFVGYLIFKDMPPFVYYILTLVTGVMLYQTG